MRLSILDLVPVRADQTSASALAATTALARLADDLGYTRYWVAEHHNMPAVAATSPPVLIAHLGAHTQRIRLGSGGVMLPNHAPLAVAEQFALLEAANPGRIDLGIGRAPGTDPITSMALRGAAGRDETDIQNFPNYLDDVRALMSPDGVRVALHRQSHVLKATPSASGVPHLWLLGSSMYSAHLAAAKGLPYVFAHHFSGQGTAEALATYRAEFQPSEACAEPTTFLTVNASVAPLHQDAVDAAVPQMLMMARLRTGMPLGPLHLVDVATGTTWPPQIDALVESGLKRTVLGEPAQAAAQITELAETFGVDEVMVNPIGSERTGADAGRAKARETTVRLLAEQLL